MKKEIYVKLLGIFLIAFGFSAMGYGVLKGESMLVFWICYIGMIGIGLGCIIKNGELILSQLNILTIPLILWDIDFISFLITKQTIFGLADYFFEESSIMARMISLEHLFLIPLGVLALYLVKNKLNKRKNAWKISLIELTLLFIVLKIISISDKNVNCVFYSCIPYINPEPYALWWFVTVFLIVFLTDFIYKKSKIFISGNKNAQQKLQ